MSSSSTPSDPTPGAPVRADLVDLGRMDYAAAHAYQLERLGRRQRQEVADALVYVEHPHVITLGRSRAAEANILNPAGVEVVPVERGGDVTYHGPGQLVAYPILALQEGERDLHAFLRHLEEGMIRCLARYGLAAGREPGKTGVWIGGRKIASIGIACRRWVTFHGLALNVTTDLGYFHRINPCGFSAEVMTSIARERGDEAIALERVKQDLAAELGEVLHRHFIAAEPR